MSTITLQNFRVGSDLTVKVRLKDGGVAIDWSTLSGIRAVLYSDAQSSIAGRCDVTVDGEDPTLLVCRYAATKMQYLGVNRIVVSAKYMGETKTYDKPAFTFVRWTADQEGEQITIEDPEVTVEIDVEDVSSSILQEAVNAAFSAADRANEAAEAAEHMVDIKTGPAGKSPYKGENGNWFEWDEEASQYVDTGVRAKGETGDTPDISIGTVTTVEPGEPAAASMSGTPEAPVLNLSIPKGAVGSTPNISIGTVTTGAPGTPVVITITGTAEAPVLNITIPQGMKGDTGVSADYPITIYNGLDSDATDAALAAAQGKVLDGKISQLQQKLGNVGTELTLTPSALLPNEGFITRTNGKFSAAANYYATDYIDISSVAGQTCKMKSTIYGYAALAFYTATDESAYISGWDVNNIGSYGYATNVQEPVERELPVPATAKYARMSVYKAYYTSLNDLYIKGISTVADELSALKDKVAGLEDLPGDVTALETAQGDLSQLKTDVKTSLVGAINSLVPEGMQSVTGTMTGIYNYIQILTDAEAYERVTVVINSLSETPNAIQLYGKNGSTYQLIQAFPNFSGTEVQLLNSYEYVYVLVVYNPSKTFDYNISYSIEPEGNVLTGKKVLVIGDSISTDSLSAQYFSDNRSIYPEYGNYSSYGNYEKWVYDLVMARYFPRNVENNSIHATGFVKRLSTYENDFVSRIKKVTTPSSYDLVIVFGGINDYISNIPLGESGGDVETYFKPAVDEFFAYLSANFINARIVVLTPLRTSNIYPNTTGAYQQQYSEYIKTVSENYAIPVLDLTKGSGFMPFVPAFGAAWTFHGEGDIYPSGDGVHPTQTYEEQFLAPQIRGFLEMQI